MMNPLSVCFVLKIDQKEKDKKRNRRFSVASDRAFAGVGG